MSLYEETVISLDNYEDDSSENTINSIGISWENLNFKIKQRTYCGKNKGEKTLHILKGLSGYVNPGNMLAIIGGSGAGKSTLLDILAMRKSIGEVSGNVSFNGIDSSNLEIFMRRVSGYVTQEDIMNSTLTVRETLQFQADLRLNHKLFDKEQRIQRVEQVMKDLAIEHRADMRIGDTEKRGLSGGEKKRVAIGAQLVTDPSILFLDEPTSGLDSYNSLAVIQLLRKLAKTGKTIITTVHQPRSTMFDLFDQLLVLNFGETVYMGSAQNLTDYLAKSQFIIPQNMNPADYVIDVLLDPNRANFTSADISKLDFAQTYRNSDEIKMIDDGIKYNKTQLPQLIGMDDVNPFATGLLTQFQHLGMRHLRTAFRSPLSIIIQTIQSIAMGFVIGSIFYQLGYVAPAAIQGRTGVLFFVMINTAFAQSFTVGMFIEERSLVNRERASGIYSIGPYFISRSLIDTPFQIIQTILFSAIMYWMSGLNPAADRFFIYLAICIANTLCAAGFFSLIAAVSPNTEVGNILSPVTTVLLFLFAGYYLNANSIPDWWIWIYWISYFRYSYPAMLINEFSGSTFTCPTNTTMCGSVTGDEILTAFAAPLDPDWVWQCILILMGWVLVYRTLAFICAKFLYREKR